MCPSSGDVAYGPLAAAVTLIEGVRSYPVISGRAAVTACSLIVGIISLRRF